MRLEQYPRGWLVGDFSPSLIRSKDIEVGLKHFSAGQTQPLHRHNQTDEYTIVIVGRILMMGCQYAQGDICLVPKGTATCFEAVEDSIVLVVKHPSVPSDKELV